jgi:GlpG protein
MMNKISIGQLNNQRAAQAFCDYLKSKGTKAWIEAKEDTYIIYIEDSLAEDFSCAELREFLANPSDSKYLDASWTEGVINLKIDNSSPDRNSSLQWKSFLSRSGIMTKLLVLISVSVTLLTSFGDNIEITRHLLISDITQYQGSLIEVLNGEVWRLVTPIFLHFMVIHILFNMMWLWDLGGTVERIQSKWFLLFFVLSIGILSNLIQYYSSGPAFGGMSGVVYGLLGYTWIRSFNVQSGYQLPKSIIGLMLAWLLLGYTGFIGAIGNAAHLSGLILGMSYGFAWNQYE